MNYAISIRFLKHLSFQIAIKYELKIEYKANDIREVTDPLKTLA